MSAAAAANTGCSASWPQAAKHPEHVQTPALFQASKVSAVLALRLRSTQIQGFDVPLLLLLPQVILSLCGLTSQVPTSLMPSAESVRTGSLCQQTQQTAQQQTATMPAAAAAPALAHLRTRC